MFLKVSLTGTRSSSSKESEELNKSEDVEFSRFNRLSSETDGSEEL